MDKVTLEKVLKMVQGAIANEEPNQVLSVIVYQLREGIEKANSTSPPSDF